jgi:phosphopantothenoylcysteine decarboxylase/phosphopantothenate--cysteine ligase
VDDKFAGRTVALCVTGSIAAYKAAVVARLLVKGGAKVLPVMSASGAKFLGPVTLAGLCGEPVAMDMWDAATPGELHVSIGARADVVVVVPATADFLARLAQGRADDLVAAVALCARGPVVVAPAMHPRMWDHPATQRNVATLAVDGRVSLVGPVRGEVASGDEGMGRMAEPEEIVRAIGAALAPADLSGVRLVVTAGPTVEDLDPVRFLGNRSSGKMGFALAQRAAARGARVTLIAGPVSLATPPGVHRVDVRGALSMRDALWEALGPDLSRADGLVMAAAVADHRPAVTSSTKIKKADLGASIALVKNPDLLAEVGEKRTGSRPVLVGFAVETGGADALVGYAKRKLTEKRVDLVVANEASDAFGRDDDRAILVTQAGAEPLGTMSKLALADVVLERVKALLG